jgi:1-phosphatidylinositol-4-phosphate 5-kinase
MTEEEAERKKASEAEHAGKPHDHTIPTVDGATTSLDAVRRSSHSDRLPRSPVDKTMDRAQKQADKSVRKGANEQAVPEHTLGTVRSPSADRSLGQAGPTLPVVEEAGEAGSTGGRSGGSLTGSVTGNVVDETERGRSRDSESRGGIRRVISGEHPATEKTDGFVDAPVLSPQTTSPALMDPEKGLVCGLDKPEELDSRHTA